MHQRPPFVHPHPPQADRYNPRLPQPAQPPPQLYLLYIPTPNPRVSLSLSLQRKNRESSGITCNSTRAASEREMRACARLYAMRVCVCRISPRDAIYIFFFRSSKNVLIPDEADRFAPEITHARKRAFASRREKQEISREHLRDRSI